MQQRPRVIRAGLAALVAGILLAVSGCEASTGAGDAGESGDSRATAFDEQFEAAYLGTLHDEADIAEPASTAFRRSSGLSARIADDFLASYRPLETATRGELADFVRSGQALSQVNEQIRAYCMDPADLADVIAIHHAIDWAIANRDVAMPEDVQALRDRLAGQLARQVRGWEDGDKQRLAERHALLTALHSNEYAVLVQRGDKDAVRRYGRAIARRFREDTGIDLHGPLDTLATGKPAVRE